MKHDVYLFWQKFADGRLMIARWSPTEKRRYIKPFHPQDDANAISYLDYFGNPTIDQFECSPRLVPSLPFETIEVGDDDKTE